MVLFLCWGWGLGQPLVGFQPLEDERKSILQKRIKLNTFSPALFVRMRFARRLVSFSHLRTKTLIIQVVTVIILQCSIAEHNGKCFAQ